MDIHEIRIRQLRFWSFLKWNVYLSLAIGLTVGIILLASSLLGKSVKATIGQTEYQGLQAGLIGALAAPVVFLLLGSVMSYILILPFWAASKVTRGITLKGRFEVSLLDATSNRHEPVEKSQKTVPERVSLITIGARNLPSLRVFYRKLGWSETAVSSDTYAVFRTAGVLLSLFPIEELLKDAGLTAEDLSVGFKGVSFAINVDKPEEVDAAIEAIRQAGGRIIREASDAFWGGRIGYFMDPEDNAWEVAWNPTAVFDERGAMVSF